MKVLVVGKGAREHALCWKLFSSPSVEKVYCVPGNDGISNVASCIKIKDDEIPGFIRQNGIDLVVVGPEAPLVEGLADMLRKKGVNVFGPGKEGARLEGSKIFAKNFMKKYGIPTARFIPASTIDEALKAVDEMGDKVVIKADGLAAGKGVVVCSSKEEGKEVATKFMVKGEMGEAGKRVVVEERLEGEEVSIIAITDGKNYCILSPAQDHKRIYDGDKGPNTGGMGAFAPAARVAPEKIVDKVKKQVIEPAIMGLKEEKIDFKGALYCGLMVTPDKNVNVLEFNVRFGDPETQVQVLLMNDDLGEILAETASGNLSRKSIGVKEGVAITVVMAAYGYPTNPVKGDVIEGLENIKEDETHIIFHAGTRKVNGKWLTDGGRVLGVTALGKNIEGARKEVYSMVEKIWWRGVHFRKDIGLKGL